MASILDTNNNNNGIYTRHCDNLLYITKIYNKKYTNRIFQ